MNSINNVFKSFPESLHTEKDRLRHLYRIKKNPQIWKIVNTSHIYNQLIVENSIWIKLVELQVKKL